MNDDWICSSSWCRYSPWNGFIYFVLFFSVLLCCVMRSRHCWLIDFFLFSWWRGRKLWNDENYVISMRLRIDESHWSATESLDSWLTSGAHMHYAMILDWWCNCNYECIFGPRPFYIREQLDRFFRFSFLLFKLREIKKEIGFFLSG
jgi:hypothetical protein